jgi:hypothetical protein
MGRRADCKKLCVCCKNSSGSKGGSGNSSGGRLHGREADWRMPYKDVEDMGPFLGLRGRSKRMVKEVWLVRREGAPAGLLDKFSC